MTRSTPTDGESGSTPHAAPPASSPREQERSQSVDRAMSVLFMLARRGPLRVADLVAALGLPRRNLTRLLTSLETEGLVRRDPRTLEFDLGVALVVLGALAKERNALTAAAEPVITSLAASTQTTTLLHVRHADGLVAAIVRVPPEAFSVNFPPANRIPLHRGVGRAVLAHLPDAELNAFMQDKAVVPSDLRLDEARNNGFVTSHGEVVAGIHAVGAPVFDSTGDPVAVLAIASFSDLTDMGQHVAAAAATLTARIGGQSPPGGAKPGFV